MDGPDPRRAFGPAVPGPRRILALAAALAWTFQIASGCSLVRPPHARELVELGYRSPEHAFRSFQTALAADLPEQEFRCFSQGFRQREGLSFNSYLEGRRRLLRDRPWLVLVAKAGLERSESLDERAHLLVCEVHGRRFAVELVREDVFEMWAGRDLLADGQVDFRQDVRASGQDRLTAAVRVDPLEHPGLDLGLVTELRVAQEWKIDELYEAPTQ